MGLTPRPPARFLLRGGAGGGGNGDGDGSEGGLVGVRLDAALAPPKSTRSMFILPEWSPRRNGSVVLLDSLVCLTCNRFLAGVLIRIKLRLRGV